MRDERRQGASSFIPHPSLQEPFMSQRITTLCAAFVLLAVAGCGERTYPVSGRVTFEGKPIESGSIIFEAADGGPGMASGGIQNGKYELKSKVGKKKVSIEAIRNKPKEVDPQRALEQYIPPQYNIQSKLTAEVKPGG